MPRLNSSSTTSRGRMAIEFGSAPSTVSMLRTEIVSMIGTGGGTPAVTKIVL